MTETMNSQSLGQQLRGERERRGISIEDVSRVTRIRMDYLRALEDEEFSSLPAEVYVRGYIRSYAQFLGIDGEACIAGYRAQVPESVPAAPLLARQSDRTISPLPTLGEAASAPTKASQAMAAAKPPRRLSLALAIVVLLIAALAISVVYFVNRSSQSEADSRNPSTTETTTFDVTG